MKVHHLSCATMCPRGGRLLGGEGGPLNAVKLVAHVLLVESSGGLVLVDTGFGTGDVADPKRLGQPFRALVAPRLRESETAIAQIRELGLDPSDVRHIATTHLDVDHAGGLPDFPDAEVHVFAPEKAAMENPPLRERGRYIAHHFAHGPSWAVHEGTGGDDWYGFSSIRAIEGSDPEVLLIPLVGHSAGHCAVAVKAGERWLLHCGDGYFHHDQVATPSSCPRGLSIFQRVVEHDTKARQANVERLRELVASHGDEVTTFCAHDRVELERMQSG